MLKQYVFIALRSIGSLVRYDVGSCAIECLGSQRWFRHCFYRRRSAQIKKYLAQIGSSKDVGNVIKRHFVTNALVLWRIKALSRLSPEKLDSWVTISNLDVMQQRYNEDKGVVLITSHIGACRTIPLVLARKGFCLNFISPLRFTEKAGVTGYENINIITLEKDERLWLLQMMKALKILKQGGLVGVAADGLQGAGGVSCAFMGRQRTFYTSFAKLALRSDASIIPVFSSIDDSGRIHIEFSQPLAVKRPETTEEKAIVDLIQQYVALLERHFYADPGSILSRHLQAYVS